MSQPKTIFMTGAAGNIGSVITEFAIGQGFNVRGLSRSETNDAKLRSLGAIPVRGTITSLDLLTQESRTADAVIHLVDTWSQHMNESYDVVLKIDNEAVEAMCNGLEGSNKAFVFASGSALVEEATDDEGRQIETDETARYETEGFNHRYRCEEFALKQVRRGVRVVGIRLAMYVYGRGRSGVALFMGMGYKAGSVSYVGDGALLASTVHVDDAARMFLLAMEKGRAGEAYNCVNSNSPSVTLRQLNEAMAQVLGIPVASKTFEEAVQVLGPGFAKFVSKGNKSLNRKAVKELGWEPREWGLVKEITEGSYVNVARKLKEAKE
ncbi:NAD dependent epimerase/dehydratase family protein [Sarocladium implicatum]|nr:NAD dependent epimerase/dehydratase family protein [Sarocladium implicatum]